MQALEKQGKLVEMRDTGKTLLGELLTSRSNTASLAKRFSAILTPLPRSAQAAAAASASSGTASGGRNDNGTHKSATGGADAQPTTGPIPPLSVSFTEEEFPSNVVVALLDRECLLTKAKLHILGHSCEITTQEVWLHQCTKKLQYQCQANWVRLLCTAPLS
jgi:hypothetical protein